MINESTRQLPHLDVELIDLPGEIWKKVPGLEDYAQISNYGRVKRLSDRRYLSDGRIKILDTIILKQKISRQWNEYKNDYKVSRYCSLLIQGLYHHISVGRIVYYHFVNPFDLNDRSLFVTYKDGDGLNVVPDNLLLTDRMGIQRTIMDADRKDMHFAHSAEKLRQCTEAGHYRKIKAVSRYDKSGNYIDSFESLSAAAQKIGLCGTHISAAARGINNTKTAGGYFWRFGTDIRMPEIKSRDKISGSARVNENHSVRYAEGAS
jgi:hypothetical protein